nr:hypothetical protein [Candidatus Njordarchaeota archaeon]
MPGDGYGVKELFTLWRSFKWSTALMTIMFVATVGDVIFTLLNVEKYGIEYEANPIARYLIAAGQPLVFLWIALDILSIVFIYAPLMSRFIMLSPQRREGISSTIISAFFAVRITVVLYNMTVWSYPMLEGVAVLVVVGVILMFMIRFTMRHGDETSFGSLKLAFRNLWDSLKSSFGGSASAGRVATSTAANPSKGDAMSGGGGAFAEKRRKKRIAFLVGLLFILPLTLIAVMQVLQDFSGVTGKPWWERTLITIGGEAQGSLFLAGFVLTILTMASMVYLVLALFDELRRGRPAE